jgi:serine phosphatase RsbU (regulator of sigma subunit)
VLYTDGLIEANSLKTDEMFQHSGMEDVLKAYSYMKGGDYLTAVMDELIIFRGESSFDDDICIVTLDVP